MTSRFRLLLFLAFTGLAALAIPAHAADFPGKTSDFHSFVRHDFQHEGRNCIVVAPKTAAEGRPWIWRARFFGHEPQADVELLKRGWHVAYADVAGLFGAPKAVAFWDSFYARATTEFDLHKRPALEGMSRGGLIIYNWAKQNPDKLSCIYADAPVCDIKSWPGGKGVGKGSAGAWKQCLSAWEYTEAQAQEAKTNPFDGLEPLAAARIPLLHIVGDTDDVVPVPENTAILEARFKKLKGSIHVIHKPGVGHHPHSLVDPTPIVDFVLTNRRDLTIVLAGDSTVTDKAGWGAAFAKRCPAGVKTINLARGGASSKSFRDAGLWKPVAAIRPDYVFIQFGHNDMPGKGPARETDPATTFRENLARYVAEARAAGATPILVSSPTRRLYENGRIASLLNGYAEGARAVAKQTSSPLVDLHPRTVALHNELGPEKSAAFGPEGDRTHYNAQGAERIVDLIFAELTQTAPELAKTLQAAR